MDPSSNQDGLLAKIQELEAQVKLRTDQLMASTSRAYSFLDSLNMGFILCDVNGEIVLTNSSIQKTLALKNPSVNEYSLDVVADMMRPDIELKHLVLDCLASSQPDEIKNVSFGGRALHLFLAPMINEVTPGDKQNIGAVILIEDVTEQKQLERSKDEFLSIASHELRTPLTAIRGNASLIKKYYGDKLPDKDTVEMIDDIHESAVRLIDIVNDFLDVSALEQGKLTIKPEPFSIIEVSEEVVRELKNLCESKGIVLANDPSVNSCPPVLADKQRIKQVLYNLIGNATKFTDHGSITISAQQDDNFVYITVTDTGKGMSAESQKLLFHKFQQAGTSILTRDGTKGTGLGLYISKLIVELSGGRIGLARSEVGVGTSFAFSLPRYNNQSA